MRMFQTLRSAAVPPVGAHRCSRTRTRIASALLAAVLAMGPLVARADDADGSNDGDAESRFHKAYETEVVDGKLADAAREGKAMSRVELLRAVWGDEEVVSRVIDTAILGLRKKVEEDPATPRHVLSVRGVGYRFRRKAGS